MSSTTIGKVSATEKNPTCTDNFTFWLDDNVEIKPFDIVKANNEVQGKKSTTYAIVEDIFHITDSTGHLSNYVSSDFGDIDCPPMSKRLGVTYANAKVIKNTHEVYMPLKDSTLVEFADEDDIKDALGLNDIDNPIPAGFIEGANGVTVPINLNSEFLIGPEGAHLNISGISGLATKTSYAMFLLQSIQQTVDDAAIIILNVKGDDLLRIDEDNPLLTDPHKNAWEKTGLTCKPFEKVRYFYPYKNNKEGHYANTALDKAAISRQADTDIMQNFIYTYDHDKNNIDLIFSNVDDPSFTMESIINVIIESDEFSNMTWDDFKSKLGDKCAAGCKSSKNAEIPVQSWRKFKRLIQKSVNNPFFVSSKSGTSARKQCFLSDEIKQIKRKDIFVIDVARLEEQLQCLVFGDILKAVNELKFGETDRKEEDIPGRVIIFVDELNKYAASNAPKNSPILRYLLEITERGRSEGIILFSAEQFKSAVHDRVKGNCSTHIYGRTNAIEISKPDYKYIPKVFSNMMTRLSKGELILEHAILGTPLKMTFPYPSYYQRKNQDAE
jgi:hypothetical protein